MMFPPHEVGHAADLVHVLCDTTGMLDGLVAASIDVDEGGSQPLDHLLGAELSIATTRAEPMSHRCLRHGEPNAAIMQ
jgi:hypothetical protein